MFIKVSALLIHRNKSSYKEEAKSELFEPLLKETALFDTVKILGINFINSTPVRIVDILKKGGLLIVPAAPALINIKTDIDYYNCILNSDIALPDSAYMALIWNLLHKKKIKRISGLKLLQTFFADEEIKTSSVLLVNPNAIEAQHNISYFLKAGFQVNENISYVAPWYNRMHVEDERLLALIEQKKPKYILINIAGGVQEKLGIYLKQNLSYRPAIICTGAAIAFLTGQQAHIPNWADKLFLGWFIRCIKNPRQFIPRYFKAFRLAAFIMNYGSKQPF